MDKVMLDTETTGLDPRQGHRIIEVAAIRLEGRRVSKQHFHRYINPEREVEAEAAAVHGLTLDRLQNEPLFSDIVHGFLEFIEGTELVIHNAPFDMGFLNHELSLLGMPPLQNPVLDTLKMARDMFPGKKNNLDALCSRFDIDNAHRTLHGALLDTELLAEVYLAMTRGQNSLLDDDVFDHDYAGGTDAAVMSLDQRPPLKVVSASEDEISLHQQTLQAIADKAGECLWLTLDKDKSGA